MPKGASFVNSARPVKYEAAVLRVTTEDAEYTELKIRDLLSLNGRGAVNSGDLTIRFLGVFGGSHRYYTVHDLAKPA